MKSIKRILILLLLLAVTAGGGTAYLVYRTFLIPTGRITQPIIVVVNEGDTLSKAAEELKKRGAILDERLFVTAARYLGAERLIRTGEYKIDSTMSPKDILVMLMKGRIVQYPVTVPEGLNIYQVSDLLAEKGFVDVQEFLRLTKDDRFIESLGVDALTLEGYLFPDTYHVSKGMREQEIITLMVRRYFEVFNEEKEKSRIPNELTDYETLILASMIEKETGTPQERPLVSAVFRNRLGKEMKLDSCATVIYGIWDRFDGNLTQEDLSTWTAYNTYMNPGLPPGPICNPGRESITAAITPADADYLYFVSKNDGTSYFSSTLSEHNRAVYEYQILRKNRK
ncbi:MAG: endolytic transglycosylase MltG [Deltaproteobacteria bacterium]|nr:endolytic transglycosylase MltG [Candidatus Zymogenaceae bacterium]